MRIKADKDSPNARIYQVKAPHAVIGGNHVGADMLAQIVIDKYRYHLPEYRQARQYADFGLKLPTSTLKAGCMLWLPDWNLFTRLCATTSVTAIIYR